MKAKKMDLLKILNDLSEEPVDEAAPVEWKNVCELIVQLVSKNEALEHELEKERKDFFIKYTAAQETILRLSNDLYYLVGEGLKKENKNEKS